MVKKHREKIKGVFKGVWRGEEGADGWLTAGES
jgi:hypothetical protein